MQTFAHYALPAAIVASALGAIVICVVLLLYGFGSTADDEPRFASRRLFVIRIGHALAATCFAAVVMLTSVAFLGPRRAVVLAEPAASRSSDDIETLDARMSALEQRLQAAEARSSDTPAQPVIMESPTPAARRALTPRRAGSPDRASRSSSEGQTSIALPPRGAGESPVNGAAFGDASPPPMPPASSLDVRAKVGNDWEIIKRGFRDAGKDIQSSLSELPRRVKRSFGSDDR